MTDKQRHQVEELLRISGVDPRKCMKCGKCSGACPAYKEMEFHPHQFVTMVERGRVDELIESGSHLKCISCFACDERCPRSVDPAKLIEAVRVTAIRKDSHLKVARLVNLLNDDIPQQAITSALRKFAR